MCLYVYVSFNHYSDVYVSVCLWVLIIIVLPMCLYVYASFNYYSVVYVSVCLCEFQLL